MKRRELLQQTLSAGIISSAFPFDSAMAHSNNKIQLFDACGFPGNQQGRINAETIADMQVSGYKMLQTTVGVVGNVENAFSNSINDIKAYTAEINKHHNQVMLIESQADIKRCLQNNKIGIVFGFQDTSMLEGDLSKLEVFNKAGVRCLQLTYNLDNLAASGCLSKIDGGLKPFGIDVMREAQALGMLVDLSHCSHKTTEQAIALTKAPVSITHAGCESVYSHPRNKSDKTLKKLADQGGVVGIYFMPYLCSQGTAKASDLIKHIEHAINICGEDNVGIGTDNRVAPTELNAEYLKQFAESNKRRKAAGIAAPREDENSHLFIEDLNSLTRFADLAILLEKRGHSEARINKILAGNFTRLFAETLG